MNLLRNASWSFGLTVGSLFAAQAAAAADAPTVAMAVVENRCLLTNPAATSGDEGRPTEGVFAILGSALGGFAGDLFAAAGDALGGVLEEVSRERTFSAESVTSFEFYDVQEPDQSEFQDAVVEPRLKRKESICLIMSAPAAANAPPWDLSPLQERSDLRLTTFASDWVARGLPANPAFYMEAELQRRADGFRIRPVLIWYRSPLPGAPRRRLPTEIHATFSTPSAPTEEAPAGDVFATVRMRLPALEPGSPPLFAPNLLSLASPVVPMRPTTGSAETIRTAVNDALTTHRDHLIEVEGLRRAVARADDDGRAEAEDALRAAEALTPRLAAEATRAESLPFPIPVGTTNVSVRFAVVRNANAFGMAIARALRARTETAGTALSEALAPRTREQAWTEADTTWITEMTEARAAQRALDQARQGGDADAIFDAEQALRIAKAQANAAAAAAGRALPFPNP